MKITILSVGKIKEKYLTDGVAEYAKRLSRYCDFKVVEVDEASEICGEPKKRLEGERLIEKMRGYVIALDGGGKQLTSEGLASMLDAKKTDGVSEFTFVIGGSNGLSDGVLKRADYKLSFGNLTFPHQLFRLMLSEQIYRACTILAGTPYHK